MPFSSTAEHGTESQAGRVLVVARDEDARSMFAFLLRAEGLNVYALADVSRARPLLRLSRGPVTVILDDSVPDDELASWFQMLYSIAQVTGIVLRRRHDALPARAASWLARIPYVVIHQPLQIGALLGALAAVGVGAARGPSQPASRMGTAAIRTDSELPVVRPFPA